MIARQIANAHTIFNVVMTLIWIPLIPLMVKIVMKIIPAPKKAVFHPDRPIILDDKMINQPVAALQLIAREVVHCSKIAEEMLSEVIVAVREGDKHCLHVISDKGELIRDISEKMSGYLAELYFRRRAHRGSGSADGASDFYILNDLDRIGTLCVEVAKHVWDKEENKYQYSRRAMEEVQESLEIIKEMYDDAMDVLVTKDKEKKRKSFRGGRKKFWNWTALCEKAI